MNSDVKKSVSPGGYAADGALGREGRRAQDHQPRGSGAGALTVRSGLKAGGIKASNHGLRARIG